MPVIKARFIPTPLWRIPSWAANILASRRNDRRQRRALEGDQLGDALRA